MGGTVGGGGLGGRQRGRAGDRDSGSEGEFCHIKMGQHGSFAPILNLSQS